LKKECDEEIHTKRYLIREIEGHILIWFHADDNLREKPLWEPFIVNTPLDYRGESINYVSCHI